MSSLFNDLSEELFQILKGSGKQLTLYDVQGNRTYEPSLARRVFVEPDKMMVSVHEAGSDSEVAMYLSDITVVDDIAHLINTLRQISTRYNVLLNVRKYGHTLTPKDFAFQVERVAEAAMYGTTKTSYQRIGETKLVVRHARPVNADITGSRSRNILGLFVETKLGERFRFPVRHLSGARAFAQHINQGGAPHDPTALRIVEMAQESSHLAKVSRYIQYAKSHLSEEAQPLRTKIRERVAGIRSTLQSMSRPRGYKGVVESKRLSPAIQIHEGDNRPSAEVARLASMLKIDSNHALAESLLPVALLNLGEIAMTNINEMFYEGISVPADLMRELTEALANEYGYAEGADWAFVDKGGYNAIYFENQVAHADACDLLENIMGCGFLAEDTQDKILQYATNWMAKRNAAIGGDAAPGKDVGKETQELAAGIQAVLSGAAVAHPNDTAGGPSFADPAAELAFKLSLFLEPTAGMKNDSLFNYISTIVDKLQSGAQPTGTELLIAHQLAGQVSVGEAVSEEEVFEASEDGVTAYAQKWTAQRFGQAGTNVVNKSEEERDMLKATAELADGLKAVFSGQKIASAKYPTRAETPRFTSAEAQRAYELSMFLEPEAGLKNDAMFNYIGTLIQKLQDGEKLTGPENLVMDRLLDQVDDSAHMSADESIDEAEFGDYYKPPVDDGSFGKEVDEFAEDFVQSFDDATMDKISDYAGLSFDCVRRGESIADYFASSELSAEQIAEIKDAIGSYADREFSDMDTLPENEKQYIVSHVWPKVQKYLTGLGFQLAESVSEDIHDPAAEFHNGAVACAQGVGRDANPHEADSDEYEYWDSGWQKQAGQDRASHMSDIADRFGDEAADHLYDSVNEAKSKFDLEFNTWLDLNGVDEVEVTCKCDIDGADERTGLRYAYVTVIEVIAVESGEDIAATLSDAEMEILNQKADAEMHQQAAERAAEEADHRYDRMRDERMERDMDEDVATMTHPATLVHPAMIDGKHVATDFGPGTIIDSIPGGVKVELQNGEVVEVPEGEFDVLESRIREEAELDAWFEGFDPASVLAPVELDEYQVDPADTRLATGDRVVHKKFGPGNVVAVEGNFVKVKFDRANALLPQDRIVTLSPGILYKVSQDAAAIRKEPEPKAQPGDKIRRKMPYQAPVQMQPGDKIRRKDFKPAVESFEISEEAHEYLGNLCKPETLEKIFQELSQYANDMISTPTEFNLPDPNNLHYDDTDEEAAEFARKFREMLAGKLTDLLYDAEHGVFEAEKIDELSKNMVTNYFDAAAQSRGKLEKASDGGDEVASKKLVKRDQSLDHAWKKMHEAVSPAGDEMTETRFRGKFEGDPQDFCNAVHREFGDKVYEQAYAILMDDEPFEEQNWNALSRIMEIADKRGESEFSDTLHAFLTQDMGKMDEEQGEDSGLTLPGDAGDAFIADVSKPHGEGEYTVYGKTFKTKTFGSDAEANAWLENNPDHGVLGVKDHRVHVGHMDEELDHAMGMERILKLSGQKR